MFDSSHLKIVTYFLHTYRTDTIQILAAVARAFSYRFTLSTERYNISVRYDCISRLHTAL